MAQGPLENLEAFARDFNCADGSSMNPSEKCQVSLVLLFQTIATCQQTFSALVSFSILVLFTPLVCSSLSLSVPTVPSGVSVPYLPSVLSVASGVSVLPVLSFFFCDFYAKIAERVLP